MHPLKYQLISNPLPRRSLLASASTDPSPRLAKFCLAPPSPLLPTPSDVVLLKYGVIVSFSYDYNTVLVEWYHHVVLTMSFKLVSFYIYFSKRRRLSNVSCNLYSLVSCDSNSVCSCNTCFRRLYWTGCSRPATIQTANVDGSDRQTLISDYQRSCIVGIAIDFTSKHSSKSNRTNSHLPSGVYNRYCV